VFFALIGSRYASLGSGSSLVVDYSVSEAEAIDG